MKPEDRARLLFDSFENLPADLDRDYGRIDWIERVTAEINGAIGDHLRNEGWGELLEASKTVDRWFAQDERVDYSGMVKAFCEALRRVRP